MMSQLRLIAFASLFAVFMMVASGSSTFAQDLLLPYQYYWYVPEHESYGRTSFYTRPSFNVGTTSVLRTERFRILEVKRGWALLEFDTAGKLYVHLRVLRTMIYDSAANDPWYEFRRASVFREEPQKIEARLKGPAAATATEPAVTDSKTPAWKRYKDSWGIKSGRPAPSGSDQAVNDVAPPRSATTSTSKPRSKYPLLTPLGSEQPQDPVSADTSGQDAPASR